MYSSLNALADFQAYRSALTLAMAIFNTAFLFGPQPEVTGQLRVDYIVVGGGTAGSIIANRLTEDPRTTVLLIEAGGNPDKVSELPGHAAYVNGGNQEWRFKDTDSAYTLFQQNSIPILSQGKVLGGSSSVNYMHYIRGAPADYDAIADLIGDDSWKYENILKYFKKAERYYGKLSENDKKYHGTEGYIGVTKPDNDINAMYLQGAAEFGAEILDDFNGEKVLGFGNPMYNMVDGVRQSTAYSYLSGKFSERKNLIIYRNTMATRIIFYDNKKATGVEAIYNGQTYQFFAEKEVIVSAGPFGSPKLLLLSGIGPQAELSALNMKSVSDLPVGKNLQDHASVIIPFNTGIVNFPDRKLSALEYPTPMIMGTLSFDANSKTPEAVAYNYRVDAFYFRLYCVIIGYSTDICDAIMNKLNPNPGAEIIYSVISLVHPKSRGSVTLKTTNTLDDPVIKLARLSDTEDLQTLVKYVQYFVGTNKTSILKKINASVAFINLPDNNAVPGSIEYWTSYVSHLRFTFESFAGTCAIGGVVDSNFNVIGVTRLRVADLSVLPLITSGTMNTPAVMIGEKCADVIKNSNDYKITNRVAT